MSTHKVWHITKDGLNTLCGVRSRNRIHIHYFGKELDSGSWCKVCTARVAKAVIGDAS